MAMEGVPRIPMISFPMKRSVDTPNFRPRLRAFISDHYNENPDSYNGEINELDSLRASATHVSKDYTGCATLKKYFCQLNFLKSRFPLHEGSPIATTFSWYDVYSDQVHGWSDIDFEMSCVLFNIGALHSELGTIEKRQTSDGIKSACTHFQCAAWAFQHLRHNYQKFFTPDVSPDILNIMINVCLGQAQECILEKSLIDNRKSTIQAKVVLYIVEYYQLSLKTADQMLKDSNQYSEKTVRAVKMWKKLMELKVTYYSALAHLFRGLQSEDDKKWGERITFYKAAGEKLEAAFKLAKNMDKTDSVHETLAFTNDVIVGKLKVSEKENEFIYHDKVPELNAVIGDLKGVSLVKGVPINVDDPEVSGPDIFGRLVPMEAHEASSLYSEEKAKILRTYTSKIEDKNQALDKFLMAIQLNQLDLHTNEMRIPQELVDCCAALSANKDAVKRLAEMMAALSGLFHDVDGNLNEIHEILQEQEAKEKEYQSIMGKRPPNNMLTELSREERKHQSAHKSAAESNQQLHEVMRKHLTNIQILMKPFDEVLKHIPSASEIGVKDENAILEMQRLAAKVDEMQKQRDMLERQLRESIQKDDITKQLVVKKEEEQDNIFEEALKKHEKFTSLIDQNLLAQENIIRALTEANSNYSETRKATGEMIRKRDNVIQGLIASYEAYDELIVKCNSGIDFYKKLDENVLKLLQKVRSVAKVQDEERGQVMQNLMKKLPNQPPNMPSTYCVPPGDQFGKQPSSGHPKLKDFYTAPAMRKPVSSTDQIIPNRHDQASSMTSQQYAYSQNSSATGQQQQYQQYYQNYGQQVQPAATAGVNQQPHSTVPATASTNPPQQPHPAYGQQPQQYFQAPNQPPNMPSTYSVPPGDELGQQPSSGHPKLKDFYTAPVMKNPVSSTDQIIPNRYAQASSMTSQQYAYSQNPSATGQQQQYQQYYQTYGQQVQPAATAGVNQQPHSALPASTNPPQQPHSAYGQQAQQYYQASNQPPNMPSTYSVPPGDQFGQQPSSGHPKLEDFYTVPAMRNPVSSTDQIIPNRYAQALSMTPQQYAYSQNSSATGQQQQYQQYYQTYGQQVQPAATAGVNQQPHSAVPATASTNPPQQPHSAYGQQPQQYYQAPN